MEEAKIKFEVGKQYYYRFMSDWDSRVDVVIVKRTAKTITYKGAGADERIEPLRTRRINVLDGMEYIATDRYSMAPTIWAKHTA